MAERIIRERIAERAIIHAAPVLRAPATPDRNFELPAALFGATAALYFGFVAVMAIGFGNPHMIVPLGIIVTFIAMFFAVPAMWMRMKPDHAQRLTGWGRFQATGVQTLYGHMTAGAATVQVLILPALIFGWAVAVVTIVAVIR